MESLQSNLPIEYECHVTVEPVFGVQLAHLVALASAHGFKVANLIMKRGKWSLGRRSRKDAFMSAKKDDIDELNAMGESLVRALERNGYEMIRYKIEAVIVDRRWQGRAS